MEEYIWAIKFFLYIGGILSWGYTMQRMTCAMTNSKKNNTNVF